MGSFDFQAWRDQIPIRDALFSFPDIGTSIFFSIAIYWQPKVLSVLT